MGPRSRRAPRWGADTSLPLLALASLACLPGLLAFLEDYEVERILADVSVYTYPLSSVGLAPELELLSPWGRVCSECARPRDPTAADLCNYAFGSPIASPVAYGHQGVLWSNKGRGETLPIQVLLCSALHTQCGPTRTAHGFQDL